MGKQRHQKDRLYLIPSEYAISFGGYKSDKKRLPFQSLPFYCCGLTLLPFNHPVVVSEEGHGIIFDKEAILKWLSEYSQNPVSGKPLKRSDLIDLTFHKNAEGEFHCPITFKVFNEHSSIVANRKSQQVYSKEAVDEICRKSNTWRDLITNEPFSSKDLITIQDPTRMESRTVERFYFVRNKIDGEAFAHGDAKRPEDIEIHGSGLANEIIRQSKETNDLKRAHETLMADSTESNKSAETPSTKKRQKLSTLYTTSGQAASLTSTAVSKKLGLEFRELTDVEIRFSLYQQVRKSRWKSYVRLQTSLGPLSLELRSDLAPQTCDNFIRHCRSGYYDNTIFHRMIPRFMIQGGDPLGTGLGGQCAFERMEKFNDEIHPELRHSSRGIISMANSGLDTNKSQFFILFAPAPHLDELHTVFGSVVGGMETLDAMESLKTVKDTPEKPPRILTAQIFTDAFEIAAEALERKRQTKEGDSASGIKKKKDPKQEKIDRQKEKSKSFIDNLVGPA